MFVTKVEIKPHTNPIGYNDRIVLWGSCFAENMAAHLAKNKFNISLNPFGILFNPESIAHAIERTLDGTPYTSSDIFLHQGQYHSFDFHSRYSAQTQQETLTLLNQQRTLAQNTLSNATTLIVTFGSAFVYRTLSDGKIVANCHKMPERTFLRQRLTVQEIANRWSHILQRIPHIKQVIFSVSPVRHLRDGLHENQLSKATLLLAIDQIVQSNTKAVYFPAYEIVQDELRDYRYYDADMTHPSTVAVDHIWQQFMQTFISPLAHQTMERCAQIDRDLSHRPLAPDSDTYRQFLLRTKDKINELLLTHPIFDFVDELNEIERRIMH